MSVKLALKFVADIASGKLPIDRITFNNSKVPDGRHSLCIHADADEWYLGWICYHAVGGGYVQVFMDCGGFDYFEEIVLPDGTELDTDQLYPYWGGKEHSEPYMTSDLEYAFEGKLIPKKWRSIHCPQANEEGRNEC